MQHIKTYPVYQLLAMIGVIITSSSSVSASCTYIENNNDRLACYDQTSEPPKSETLIGERQRQENSSSQNRFSLTPHKLNYILPLSYNASANYRKYGPFEDLFKKAEVKFQLSLKMRLLESLWRNSYVDAAYTQTSFWQLYAKEGASAPFRETNHEPEVIWTIPLGSELLGFNARHVSLALNHQSNGRSEPLSRSWNRISNAYVFEKENVILSFKWWLRLEESSSEDDNPDIEEYMGRMQFGAAYKLGNQTLALGIINNADKENRSGVQLDWLLPLSNNANLYIQGYTGYGENLIDQEDYTNRLSLGVSLTNWL